MAGVWHSSLLSSGYHQAKGISRIFPSVPMERSDLCYEMRRQLMQFEFIKHKSSISSFYDTKRGDYSVLINLLRNNIEGLIFTFSPPPTPSQMPSLSRSLFFLRPPPTHLPHRPFPSPFNTNALHFPCDTIPSHSRNIHGKEALNDLFYYNIKAARSSTVNY